MAAIPATHARLWSWTATIDEDDNILVVGEARYDAQDGVHYTPMDPFGYVDGDTVPADEIDGALENVESDASDTGLDKYYSFS